MGCLLPANPVEASKNNSSPATPQSKKTKANLYKNKLVTWRIYKRGVGWVGHVTLKWQMRNKTHGCKVIHMYCDAVNLCSCTALRLLVWMRGRRQPSRGLIRATVSNEKWQLPSPGEPSCFARLQILFACPTAAATSHTIATSLSLSLLIFPSLF